ncbi:MAG: hypothetical protein K6F86_00940 [Lachnospiraceae bacterium]|nr:hypothetical protein [Lachnospiraceae bacterium]
MKKKPQQVKRTEYIRPCREVICPFCDHRFMWLGSPESPQPTYYYRNRETGEGVYDAVCPECGEEIILEPHVLLGEAPYEDKYEKIGIRGI